MCCSVVHRTERFLPTVPDRARYSFISEILFRRKEYFIQIGHTDPKFSLYAYKIRSPLNGFRQIWFFLNVSESTIIGAPADSAIHRVHWILRARCVNSWRRIDSNFDTGTEFSGYKLYLKGEFMPTATASLPIYIINRRKRNVTTWKKRLLYIKTLDGELVSPGIFLFLADARK